MPLCQPTTSSNTKRLQWVTIKQDECFTLQESKITGEEEEEEKKEDGLLFFPSSDLFPSLPQQ